jgi:DNA-binding CsgD family transcriptional regulator
MDNTIDVIQPLHAETPMAKAEALWLAAEYQLCLALLQQNPPSARSSLLAAWSLYRLRRYDDALTRLDSERYSFSGRDGIEADALAAVLCELVGKARESEIFAGRALAAQGDWLSPKACNVLAIRAFLVGNDNECIRLIQPGEKSLEGNTRANALNIRAWLCARSGRFIEHAQFLRLALNALSASNYPDVGLAANVLQALSGCSLELYTRHAFEECATAAQNLKWTSDTVSSRYHTERHLAWGDALRGDFIGGIRRLIDIRTVAQSDATVALCFLDSAALAFMSREEICARAFLDHVASIVDRLECSVTEGEEVLLVLRTDAELSAAIDPARARRIVEKYDDFRKRFSATVGAAYDGSLEAAERYVRAVVMAANSCVPSARRQAKAAYEIFRSLGYEWRAAKCALFLYRSGCGDKWFAAAKEMAANYPRSSVAVDLEEIRADMESDVYKKLTPRQREVVKKLAEGNTVEDVAVELKMRPTTVRTHVRRVHERLGVHNRTELVTRAVLQSTQ